MCAPKVDLLESANMFFRIDVLVNFDVYCVNGVIIRYFFVCFVVLWSCEFVVIFPQRHSSRTSSQKKSTIWPLETEESTMPAPEWQFERTLEGQIFTVDCCVLNPRSQNYIFSPRTSEFSILVSEF